MGSGVEWNNPSYMMECTVTCLAPVGLLVVAWLALILLPGIVEKPL